jgi:hypothetical protein
MKKTLLTLTAAAAIGTAGIAAAPTQANAAWWVAPVIIGSAVVGTAAVASAANAQGYYGPAAGPGTVYVRPTASTQCFWARERVPGGWRRIQVCN